MVPPPPPCGRQLILNIVLKLMLKTHNTLENEFGFILWWKGEIENILWWRGSYSGGLFKERAGVLACQRYPLFSHQTGTHPVKCF